MERFVLAINWGIILTPVAGAIVGYILSRRRINDYMIIVFYALSGVIVPVMTLALLSWWDDYSTTLLLDHYDALIFNSDSGSYYVSYDNVLPENLSRVKQLKYKYLGIPSTFKLMISAATIFPLFITPYAIGFFSLFWVKGRS